MTRQVLITLVILGSIPGCGMAVRKLDRESLAAAVTVSRTFPQAPQRVAVAALETMRAELASADFAKDNEFFINPRLANSDGLKPPEGQVPEEFQAFWVEWKQKGQTVRELVSLRASHFAGKTRDGRPVEIAVLNEPGGTVMTIHIDDLGDRIFSQMLYDKVAHRLARPSSPPGSLEEAAMLKSFFGGVESRQARSNSRKKAEAPAP